MDMKKEEIYAAALQKTAYVGAVKLRQLIRFFGSFEAIWQASEKALLASHTLGPKSFAGFLAQRKMIEPEKIWEANQKWGVSLLTFQDGDFPKRLQNDPHAPAILAYRGTWREPEKAIAIVGSRKPTPYGINAARLFAGELSKAGVAIISGGARGIDSTSHRATLPDGYTICVLACGLDIPYPPENKSLFDEIAQHGVVISEYALGTKPLGRQFPARNRIISGLSDGVLVIEAAKRSGTLITADFALEAGRDVFAVPGSIFSPMSVGTHHLLRQGAALAAEPNDILREYNWLDTEREVGSVTGPDLTPTEELVYRCCQLEKTVDMDTIILRSALHPTEANYILLQLELKGLIQQCGNQKYMAMISR